MIEIIVTPFPVEKIEQLALEVVAEPTFRENAPMSRANLNKDPDEVAAMFDGVESEAAAD